MPIMNVLWHSIKKTYKIMMIITIGFSLNEWSRRDVIRLNPFIGKIICAFNHDDDLVSWK